MEDLTTLKRSEVSTGKKVRINFKRAELSNEKTIGNPGLDKMIAEGDGNFFHYLNRLGLENEPNLLVLPSSKHYYYDNSDLKDVTTLINMKELNQIDHLDSFLNTVYDILSPKTNFIGCFYDKETRKGRGLSSRIYKKLINFLDSKVDNEIDKKDVSRLLESQGYKVIDMTEINGKTYFRTQNYERRA
jgi:hypothetical protein